jgi:hypothetical protein
MKYRIVSHHFPVLPAPNSGSVVPHAYGNLSWPRTSREAAASAVPLKVPCNKYKQISDIKSLRENYVLQTFRFYDYSSPSGMAWETNVVQGFLFFQVSESCLIVT